MYRGYRVITVIVFIQGKTLKYIYFFTCVVLCHPNLSNAVGLSKGSLTVTCFCTECKKWYLVSSKEGVSLSPQDVWQLFMSGGHYFSSASVFIVLRVWLRTSQDPTRGQKQFSVYPEVYFMLYIFSGVCPFYKQNSSK